MDIISFKFSEINFLYIGLDREEEGGTARKNG